MSKSVVVFDKSYESFAKVIVELSKIKDDEKFKNVYIVIDFETDLPLIFDIKNENQLSFWVSDFEYVCTFFKSDVISMLENSIKDSTYDKSFYITDFNSYANRKIEEINSFIF